MSLQETGVQRTLFKYNIVSIKSLLKISPTLVLILKIRAQRETCLKSFLLLNHSSWRGPSDEIFHHFGIRFLSKDLKRSFSFQGTGMENRAIYLEEIIRKFQKVKAHSFRVIHTPTPLHPLHSPSSKVKLVCNSILLK